MAAEHFIKWPVVVLVDYSLRLTIMVVYDYYYLVV